MLTSDRKQMPGGTLLVMVYINLSNLIAAGIG